MNILLLASHAVAEYDDLRMFTDLGFDTFAPGGYEVPSRSGEGIRPPLPDAPHHPDLVARLQEVRMARGEPGPAIDWGKAALHDDIIDWADAIIVHHFVDRWIAGQWDRIKHKRVIWRTCGQSDGYLEMFMGAFRAAGLQIVRYSPKEREFFGPDFAGEDALIRFGKYPSDYRTWIGDNPVVGNITQHMKQRGDACGYGFWEAATEGLPVRPAGPGSEEMRGGLGTLDYPAMLDYLRHLRCYLYTGTRPASYTLGLIEAMMAGVPTVSIGPEDWGDSWGGGVLFEGHELATNGHWSAGPNHAERAHTALRILLEEDRFIAEDMSRQQRARAMALFDVANVGAQWVEFLR
jgi:hypothetical protein